MTSKSFRIIAVTPLVGKRYEVIIHHNQEELATLSGGGGLPVGEFWGQPVTEMPRRAFIATSASGSGCRIR
ncbi:hypothetical protein [Streptomyces sp. MUM 2J]|uniref:hypothetical protein n=1 Tax=Streptomyces sp. MUM 2J TaxID=2791987 RepID=UPI001F042BF6|nr:hypothetical protein [Streptomyces sp. MUM 2J]MCH0562197.1 hypothetical protein [Streptomyces sp. MUM 2J]